MIEIVTTDTLPDHIANDADLNDRFDGLDGSYEPHGLVLSHNEATSVHEAAGFSRTWAYIDGEYRVTAVDFWQRAEGDPDPDALMAENDIIIDATEP